MRKKGKQGWTIIVNDVKKEMPIHIYCAKAFPILGSKTAAKKAIEKGQLSLNGKPARLNASIKNGDKLVLQLPPKKKTKKIHVKLDILFEDHHMIVVHKPAGIAVNGNRNHTVENALADKNQNNPLPDALPQPVAAHRIDLPTIGIVLLAKTKSALIQLGKAFQNNKIKKEYVAVVHGKPPSKGKINHPISHKNASTEFETIETVPSKIFQHLSLVKLVPITGRTHQLRIHMQKEGHFIVGDQMYSDNKKTILGKGLLLCARGISFQHPDTNKTIQLQIDIPAKFNKIMEREKTRFSQ